jgi:hypothetical protein
MCHLHPLASRSHFSFQTASDANSLIGAPLPGDSGSGLLVLNSSNQLRVIGPHHGRACSGILNRAVFNWASVLTAENQALR